MADQMILGICIPTKKERDIKRLCQKQQISYKAVAENCYQRTMGNLAGISGIPAFPADKSAGKKPDREMLVFSSLSQEQVFSFLDQMKEEKMESVRLKAMITMHNVFWSPSMLFEEIEKEQQEMDKRKG